MANYRYGPYDDGPDPLAAPYAVREALDEMGERILGGDNTREALRALLRRSTPGQSEPTRLRVADLEIDLIRREARRAGEHKFQN